MSIKKGDTVQVDYTGTLEDGTVFDSSEAHGKPLSFEVGKGQLLPKFEEAVVGLKEGDEKEITLQAADAYGDINAELMKEVPKDQLPKEQAPEAGMILMMSLQNGQQMPVRIAKVSDDSVTLDLNHPLAGKVLHFKIKVVSIGPQEE